MQLVDHLLYTKIAEWFAQRFEFEKKSSLECYAAARQLNKTLNYVKNADRIWSVSIHAN